MEDNSNSSRLQWSVWFQLNYTDAIEKIPCSDFDEASYVYNTMRKDNEDAFRISIMINDHHEMFTNRNREYFTGGAIDDNSSDGEIY